MTRRPTAAALAMLALVAAARVASAEHGPAHPDSQTQPVFDGCRRSTGEVLAGTTPEWAYVYADREPKRLEGTVAFAHPAGDDNPTAHDSYDFNWDVRPDPGFEYLLATSNVATGGTIHNEWEEGVFPAWARPAEGDHVQVIGSWVWDCGHWGQSVDPREEPTGWIPYAQYEGVHGEGTEIHPPRAIFTVRRAAGVDGAQGSRGDLYVSSDGTPARLHAECHLSVGLNPRTGDVNERSVEQRLDAAQDGCSAWQPVNDRDYEFRLPLPPGTGPVSVEIETRERVNAPAPVATVEDDAVLVQVPFGGFGEPQASLTRPRMALGATVTARRATPAPARGARVTLRSITINADLDTEVPSEQGASYEPTEYALYAEISGTWIALHEVEPGLLASRAGDTFALDVPVDVWLAEDAPAEWLRVTVAGRECDLPRMAPCAVTEVSFGDLPGVIRWNGSEGIAETVTRTSIGGTGCGCYTLTWTIEPLP